MTDDPMQGFAGPGGQPSEEELREALGQMRAAPVDQIVAEVLSALLNAAQVKLGRRDGRLLLDLAAVVQGASEKHVDPQLGQQVAQVLTQLRLAQVEAEHEVAAAKAEGHTEPNDLDEPAGTSAPGATEPPAPAPSPPQSAASRLWVPGS
ncbi:MAG: hypothetical protein ACLGIR_10850 [Actinomycetes bacterium]